VNRDNVVPFVSSTRGALARRGAPDKSRVAPRRLDVECPNCAAVFSLETGIVARGPKVLCEACEARLILTRGEAAAD
jgi:nitrite reductase/ring-hydroxylating ferredoxin subunit